MGYSFSKARAQEQAPAHQSIQMPPIARGALARRRASHVRMSLTQLIFGLLLGTVLPNPVLTAFDESGGLFPIIDQGHGDRLAGYGVSERLRERQRCTSFEHLRHGNPIWPAFRLRRSPRLKCDPWLSE